MSSSSSSSSGIFVIAGYYPPQDVLHFQCYSEIASSGSSSLSNRNHDFDVADCCTSILRAQSRMRAINQEQEVSAVPGVDQDYPRRLGGRILSDFSIVECEQNLLYLHPPPPHPMVSQQSLPLPLIGMLTHTPNKTATQNLESEPDPCNSIVDQKVELWCSWRWFLWNDTAAADSGHWIANGKETKPMNAAWVPTRTKDNQVIPTTTTDSEAQLQNDNIASSFIHLSSTLSKSGGMHRELRQKLIFSLPTDFLAPGETAAALRSQYNYSIDILLPMPSGLFINVEDATFTTVPGMKIVVSSISSSSSRGSGGRTVSNDDSKSKVETNLNSALDTALIIDQEEPAFASPGHLVLCHLSGPLAFAPILVDSPVHDGGHEGGTDSLPTTTIELTWDTHLHVRYPLPIQSNDNDSNSHHHYYSQITFMPPIIVAGELVHTEKTSQSYTLASASNADADLVRVGTTAVPFWMLPRQAPLTLWVAAGHQDDFAPVFVLTLLAALVGTVVLLRDMMLLYTPRDNAPSSSSSSRTKVASKSSSPLSDRQFKTKKN